MFWDIFVEIFANAIESRNSLQANKDVRFSHAFRSTNNSQYFYLSFCCLPISQCFWGKSCPELIYTNRAYNYWGGGGGGEERTVCRGMCNIQNSEVLKRIQFSILCGFQTDLSFRHYRMRKQNVLLDSFCST